jgi:hypothetical protein
MIEPDFAAQLIESLIGIRIPNWERLDNPSRYNSYTETVEAAYRKNVGNLILAAECCSEVVSLPAVADSRNKVLEMFQSKLKELDLDIDHFSGLWHYSRHLEIIMNTVASWIRFPEVLPWLKNVFSNDGRAEVCSEVVSAIASNFNDDPSTLPWLKDVFSTDDRDQVCSAVVSTIASNFKDDSSILPWLEKILNAENRPLLRHALAKAIDTIKRERQ